MRRILTILAVLMLAGSALGFMTLIQRRRAPSGVVEYVWTTNDFVMTWAIPSTNAVTVPGRSGYTPDAQIYWQATVSPLAVTAWNDADLTHSYASADDYQIIITGDWPALYFNNVGNKTLITSVDSWGTGANWDSLADAFFGCTALTNCASPLPAMPNVTSLVGTWYGCSSLTTASDVSALTNVTSLSGTWRDCNKLTTASDVNALTNVNTLASTWSGCGSVTNASDVSALTNVNTLASTWSGCGSLTNASDVSALTNVTTLADTWRNCTSLTNAPDVSALTKVTSLYRTWSGCGSLTTAPDVSALTNVTTLADTWSRCSSLTTAPDVSALTNVTTLSETWRNCTSLTNLVLVDIPAVCTTAEKLYDECNVLTGNVAAIQNASTILTKWGCQDSDLTYTYTNGFFSSNVMNGFNLEFNNCNLPAQQTANILVDLDTSGAWSGVVTVAGNTAPTTDGYLAKTNLIAKAWTVTTP